MMVQKIMVKVCQYFIISNFTFICIWSSYPCEVKGCFKKSLYYGIIWPYTIPILLHDRYVKNYKYGYNSKILFDHYHHPQGLLYDKTPEYTD